MRARFFSACLCAPQRFGPMRSPAVPDGLSALNIGVLTRSRERIWS
jgi:hypothetical protein